MKIVSRMEMPKYINPLMLVIQQSEVSTVLFINRTMAK